MPATHVQFTPAASATFQGNSLPLPIKLPAVDANNPAVVLQNTGPGEVRVTTGYVNPLSGIDAGHGVVRLAEGQVVMIPNDPGFGGGTNATMQGAGRLVFTRGALANVWMFPAPGTAVI